MRNGQLAFIFGESYVPGHNKQSVTAWYGLDSYRSQRNRTGFKCGCQTVSNIFRLIGAFEFIFVTVIVVENKSRQIALRIAINKENLLPHFS